MAWPSMAQPGVTRYSMAWPSLAWHGPVLLYVTAWQSPARLSLARHGTAWRVPPPRAGRRGHTVRQEGRRCQETLCAPTPAMPAATGRRGPGSAVLVQERSHHRRPSAPSKSHTKGHFLREQGDSVRGPRCHPAPPSRGHAAAGVPVTPRSPASLGLCSPSQGTSCARDGHRSLVSARATCTRGRMLPKNPNDPNL